MDIWLSSSECAGLPGLPGTPQGVNYQARKGQWTSRARSGVKGGATEFHISALPPQAQACVLKKQGQITLGNHTHKLRTPEDTYCREALWHR